MALTPSTPRTLVLPILLACLPNPFAHAQDTGQTEQQLESIRKELGAIARERRQLESRRGAAARQLRQADEQVSVAASALRQTQAKLREDQSVLEDLRLRLSDAQVRLGELRAELARLIRKRYTQGSPDTLKELFSGEHAEQRGSTPPYQEYLQHALTQRISALQDELTALEALESEMSERHRALEAVLAEQQQRTQDLERERLARARTQAQLDSSYASHTAREHALGQDVRALEHLLARLREAAAEPGTAETAPLQPGTLLWPLSGQLARGFGERLPDGRRTTGILIDAPLGTQVHAVAGGAVVFSEWMTGYGMLLIIDHGHGQMSLYAHNESLLKQVGDQVLRGEAVASVGHSGGQDNSGLYFELRQDGRPVNPEQWLRQE